MRLSKSTKRFLVYFAAAVAVVAGFEAGETLCRPLVERFGIPFSFFALLLVVLMTFVLIGIRNLSIRLLHREDFIIADELRDRLTSLRELATHSSDVLDLSRAILEEVRRLINVSDLQLSLYYDETEVLEVTHIRLTGEKLYSVVERIREDDHPMTTFDARTMTSEVAREIVPLTFRERLVGLLLLGPKIDGEPYDQQDREILVDLAPVIAVTVDNLVMLRHTQDVRQRLFESEKLASVGQLASGIAHEIRNPLSSVKMNLQGLSRFDSLDKRNRRRVEISLEAIERVDSTIGEMMHLARRTRLEVHDTTAEELFKAAMAVVSAEVENRNINVVYDIPDGLPVIKADPSRMTTTLSNLILNAAQAIEEDGEIRLRAETYGRGLELIVKDNGPGIPEELRRDIFHPFFTTKANGTGLGLPNALKSVQEHGGELECSSEPGKGTVFYIRLPEAPPGRLDDPSALRVMPT